MLSMYFFRMFITPVVGSTSKQHRVKHISVSKNHFWSWKWHSTTLMLKLSTQGLYSIEKPLNLTACLEKSLNLTACLEKPLKVTACLEKSLNLHKALKSPWIVTEKSLNLTACLEKPLNLTGCLEKSLNLHKALEKSLNCDRSPWISKYITLLRIA